ncbi:MAG: WbqC family protein [Bacteroidales bacterium]|nr:WbqC family protein [Bacteroidales bacterium]MCF8336642.1 WbqC family protein [Bacteroidales bacterium]
MSQQAFPIAYLPPISYVAYFMAASSPVIDLYEHWPKRTYRNRAEIASPKGRYRLSVPVSKDRHHTPVREVKISYKENWQQNHWRAIRSFYSNSPYFLYYESEIKPFYEKKYDTIVDLNVELLRKLFVLLNINQPVATSSGYLEKEAIDYDYRDFFNQQKDHVLIPEYIQVFEDRLPFLHNLSVIDLLFNLGPEATAYLENLAAKIYHYYSG